jgi:hypothetical protein
MTDTGGHAPVPGTERFTNVTTLGDVRVAECGCADQLCFHVQSPEGDWTRRRGPRD